MILTLKLHWKRINYVWIIIITRLYQSIIYLADCSVYCDAVNYNNSQIIDVTPVCL